MRPNEIVHRFLASIGRPDTASQYLRLFQEERPEGFALVAIDADVIFNYKNALVADLQFLAMLELTPVLCVDDFALAVKLVSDLAADVPLRRCGVHDAGRVAQEKQMPVVIADGSRARVNCAKQLKARKVVYLITQSGLRPVGEPVRSLVNLREDCDALLKLDVLRSEQVDLLVEVRELFRSSDHNFSVSITSAQDLLRELFTIKGAGTLIRRGTEVQKVASYAELDQERLNGLLEVAFGHSTRDELYQRPVESIYFASDYEGAAVLEARPLAPYLSKFAVDIRAQGEGIGGDVWRALCTDHERFFWRSRPRNAIAPWYASQCEGLVRASDWTVYWRGLETDEIAEAVALARAAPVDFEGDA